MAGSYDIKDWSATKNHAVFVEQAAEAVYDIFWSWRGLKNFHTYEIPGESWFAVTGNDAETWIDKFGTVDVNLWTTNATIGEHWYNDLTADAFIESETLDVGSDKQSNWFFTPDYDTEPVGLTIGTSIRLALAADPSTFTDYSGFSISALARYMRAKITETNGAAGDGVRVRLPFQSSYEGEILSESGEITVSGGSAFYTYTFTQAYSSNPRIRIFLVASSTAKIIAYDNLSTTSVRIYHWDADGTTGSTDTTVYVEIDGV